MKNNSRGFSLIELLLVVTIIGILAAIAVPNLNKSRIAARTSAAVSLLKTIQNDQTSFFAENKRYANVKELATANPAIGRINDNAVMNSGYRFQSVPNNPAQLTNIYKVVGTQIEDVSGTPRIFTISESGQLTGF